MELIFLAAKLACLKTTFPFLRLSKSSSNNSSWTLAQKVVRRSIVWRAKVVQILVMARENWNKLRMLTETPTLYRRSTIYSISLHLLVGPSKHSHRSKLVEVPHNSKQRITLTGMFQTQWTNRCVKVSPMTRHRMASKAKGKSITQVIRVFPRTIRIR